MSPTAILVATATAEKSQEADDPRLCLDPPLFIADGG